MRRPMGATVRRRRERTGERMETTREKERICPSCCTYTTDSVCPNCGQPLRGWAYRRAVAVTRSAYGRVYARHANAAGKACARRDNRTLSWMTILLFPFGMMWVPALRRSFSPLGQLLLGGYVAVWGAALVCLQFLSKFGGRGNDPIVWNLITVLLLYLLPAGIAVVRGCRGLSRS